MLESESELVSRLRKGDPSAFHRLVDDYSDRLFGLAYSLLGNAQDAEDTVQETLSGAFRGIASFERRSSLWTWLANILVRQAARTRRVRPPMRMMTIDESVEASPGRSVVAKVDARVDLTAALQKLAAEHHEVIVLRELQQMSYDEISQVLKVPMGTVQSRLFRARDELRKILGDYKP